MSTKSKSSVLLHFAVFSFKREKRGESEGERSEGRGRRGEWERREGERGGKGGRGERVGRERGGRGESEEEEEREFKGKYTGCMKGLFYDNIGNKVFLDFQEYFLVIAEK